MKRDFLPGIDQPHFPEAEGFWLEDKELVVMRAVQDASCDPPAGPQVWSKQEAMLILVSGIFVWFIFCWMGKITKKEEKKCLKS